ncbi:tyrosine-type recombinase/integrase [Parabacteroides merdae]|uniref:tyrosine-type recombinase/integrase n=1 Tax=Parabacteroides merdae TaxID=46503 RepID=UPI000EFFF81E|nr:transposase [Parabacteroides merdae]
MEKWLVSSGLRYPFFSFPVLCLPILFHVARHTFGTTVTLANNVSLQNVSKMLGHSSTRMTQHYARVLDKNIMEDMQGVAKLIFK